MFTDEELTLIEAIHADPRNNAPRLAFADLCEGNGLSDLAEFIRIQCQEPYFDLRLSRTPPWTAKPDAGFGEIASQEPERVSDSIRLLEGLYGSDRFPETRYPESFRRGLPLCEVETGRFPDLLDQKELDALPLARFVLFLYWKPVAYWLMHPMMPRVDVLRFYPEYDWENEEQRRITRDDLVAFLGWPGLERLTELGLCGYLDDDTDDLLPELLKRVRVNLSH